jgi:hypothetical protein
VQDDRGTQHTCVILDAWGGVSLPSPVPCTLTPCIHSASSCSWRWCGVLVILGLCPLSPHPLCTHTSDVAPLSTPRAIAHGSGGGCFMEWVSSPPLPCPPFLLISLLSCHLTPPHPLWWWCHCRPASSPCCCPWFLLVLCWFWQCHGVLANLQVGVVISVVPVMIEQC